MSDGRQERDDDLLKLLGRELPALDVDERRAERIRCLAHGELTSRRLRARGARARIRRAWRVAEPFLVGALVACHLAWTVQAVFLSGP